MSHQIGEQDPIVENVELAAEALLREHPDALVCGLASDGLIAPIPTTVALWGQAAIEGRALIDHVVAADRKTVIDAWMIAQRMGSAEGKVRMLNRPSRWMKLHFLDIRANHGILLGVVLPTGEAADESAEADELPPATPRFSTILEDEGAKVIDCDDAFTQMFGYTAAELIGESVLDQIHPEDQARAVEGWLAMLSTRRPQQMRCRRKRKDGSFMWIDTTLHNYLNQPDRNHVLVEIIDVSAEMAAQEALQDQGALLRRLTEAMPDGLLQVDTERHVVYHNARLLEILHGGTDSASAAAQSPGESGAEKPDASVRSVATLLETVTADGMAAFEAALGRVLEEGIDQDVEVDVVLRCGDWRRALMSIRGLLRESGEVSGSITRVQDVTEDARARAELEERATYDALTGCHNRSSILAALQHELEREDSTNTAVVYVDLDEFKSVNDTLGHAAGDEVLVLVGECLKNANRADDKIGRLGGDEFLVLLRGVPGPEVAMSVARRVCDSLRTSVAVSQGTVELRASAGVACTENDVITAEELVSRADSAMYRSKDQGAGVPMLAVESQRLARSASARH
jgi:diguanylate cyclase (GGDEF)-like protein/PAS domain S-box-containing protein